MRTFTITNTLFIFASAIMLIIPGAVDAQFKVVEKASLFDNIYKEELRPFDFSDKYYKDNGVAADLIKGRRSGADGMSVFDHNDDPNHRGVRITETHPAYGPDGALIYWNQYGNFGKDAFSDDRAGTYAENLANASPIYFFPSVIREGWERQAALLEIGENYFKNNPLGLAVVILVEYTEKAGTDEGRRILAGFEARNGTSFDGTPIIKTTGDILTLAREQLVRLKVRGEDDPTQMPYIAAKAIREPGGGSIAPDAFLHLTLGNDREPLPAEIKFKAIFECYKSSISCQKW